MLFLEVDACTVNAIPNSCFVLGAIIKHMPEMTVTFTAANFGPHHSMSHIHFLDDVCIFKLIVKCRPPAPTIELVVGGKKWLLANDAIVNSFLGGIVVFI